MEIKLEYEWERAHTHTWMEIYLPPWIITPVKFKFKLAEIFFNNLVHLSPEIFVHIRNNNEWKLIKFLSSW